MYYGLRSIHTFVVHGDGAPELNADAPMIECIHWQLQCRSINNRSSSRGYLPSMKYAACRTGAPEHRVLIFHTGDKEISYYNYKVSK